MTEVAPIYKSRTPNGAATEDLFWEKIAELRWTDRSDGIMPPTNNVRIDERFNTFVNRFHSNLYNALYRQPFFHNINNMRGFLSHIIAKGFQFYAYVIENPSVCEYLVNEYQACPHYGLS
jgi:hypothetical protein